MILPDPTAGACRPNRPAGSIPLDSELDGLKPSRVSPGSELAAASSWLHEITGAIVILADAANAWKSAVIGALDEAPGQAALIVVDRFAAPRAGSFASEAGGLISPAEATDWLRFLELECPECGGEIWSDSDQAIG